MNPLALLLLLPLALLALGWSKRIFPRPIMFLWALLPALFSLALVASRQFLPWLIVLDSLILLVVAADLLTVARQNWFECQREMGRIASLKKDHPIKLTLSNRTRLPRQVWVRDDLPDECQAEPDSFSVRLAPLARTTVHYQLSAARRGEFYLRKVYLRVHSRLGLWQRHLQYACENELHVYPDMRQMHEYALLARTNRLSLAGVRRTRRIGQDNEFERLRDYTVDDNYKHIDWRSTARRNKLTVKDFQANQSQRVIFLVDCGRMMTGTAAGISLLDHAFNAALMLSYVALKRGDSVGLLCFSDSIQSFVPPRGGMNQMNRLLHASFNRFPKLVESRYDEAFVYLNSRVRKRSLVILISNVVDEVNAHQVSSYLTQMVGRHLPLGVLLRDHAVFDAATAPPDTDAALYAAAAASDIVAWRRKVLADLHTQGVLALDVFPESMTAPLVNRYLEVKARHLL